MIKKFLAAALVVGVMAPAFAFAETSASTSSIQALLEQIKTLQAQIVQIQQQQLQAYVSLAVTLKQGDSGENVKILQQLLAQDKDIYPEGRISGFYGPLTAQAIKRFQKRHGFEQVGNVGPKTLKRLNELFGKFGNSNSGKDKDKDDKNKDDEDNDGYADNASTTPGVGKVAVCHKGKTIYVGSPALWAHINHGDYSGTCSGTATTTPPVTDVTAPLISSVNVNGITPFTATIIWNTNENATSQVEYGATNSYGYMTTFNSSLVTSHSVLLSGLSASSTFHFRVVSKDAANNSASSTDMTFVTGNSDIVAPAISAVSVSGLGSTTASISWNTNESATGKIYFATTTPINFATASTQSDSGLTVSHLFPLTGLTASTTYYYVVESKDAANNTATSSPSSFVTL